MGKMELLAPAGSMDKMKMAFLYGADAVYLGGKSFGLRAFSDNFSNEELKEAVDYAHARGKHIHVTVNIFPHNDDLKALPDYLVYLRDIGVDAILIADPGIFAMARQLVPDLPVHVSTQANTTNWASTKFWHDNGASRVGVGKIGDIYAHIGLTESYHTANNHEDMEALRTQLAAHRKDKGLLMANFVDFDSMYGHRRNVKGYADCLEAFDQELGQLLTEIHDDELLVITSDHGNDPTWHGTDHTRERVPLLVYSPALKKAVDLGLRQTYADLGMTIMDNFGLTGLEFGTSFLSELR